MLNNEIQRKLCPTRLINNERNNNILCIKFLLFGQGTGRTIYITKTDSAISSPLSMWPQASVFLAVTNSVGTYGGAHCITTPVPTERNMNCHNTHNEMQ